MATEVVKATESVKEKQEVRATQRSGSPQPLPPPRG